MMPKMLKKGLESQSLHVGRPPTKAKENPWAIAIEISALLEFASGVRPRQRAVRTVANDISSNLRPLLVLSAYERIGRKTISEMD